MSSFGELLRRLRGERSQREVAKDLVMPVTTLSTLENQEVVPRGPVLRRLADYYGVPPSYFYSGGTPAMRPSDSAREWLGLVRQSAAKEGLAAYAPPEFPDRIKAKLADKIRERKHGHTSDVQQDI